MLLVTFNVANLQRTVGLEAFNYLLGNHPESLSTRFKNVFILGYVKFLLETNNMKFNNEFFSQIKSIVFVTIFTPSYTALWMGSFEIKRFNIYNLKCV